MAGKARLPAILSQMILLARLPGRVFSDDSILSYSTLLDCVEIGRAALPEIAELEHPRAKLGKAARCSQRETTDLFGSLFFAGRVNFIPVLPAIPISVRPML